MQFNLTVVQDGLDENGLEEEGDECVTYDTSTYYFGKSEYTSGDHDAYLEDAYSYDAINMSSSSNVYYYFYSQTGNSFTSGILPSSIKNLTFTNDTYDFSTDEFDAIDTDGNTFEYCGTDIETMMMTGGTGLEAEESYFAGYEFSGGLELNIETLSQTFQCRIPVTISVEDTNQTVSYEKYSVYSDPSSASIYLGSEKSFTTYANPGKSLVATLTSSGDSITVPSYNSTVSDPTFELTEVIPYDRDNYYAIIYRDDGSIDDRYTVYKGFKMISRYDIGQTYEGAPKKTTTVGGEFDEGEGYDIGAKKELYQIKFFGYCDMGQMAS